MTAMSASPAVPSRTAHPLLVLLAVLGIVAFLYGVLQGSAPRVWGIYLVNLLFWSSLAITGPALAAMIQVTEGAVVAERQADRAHHRGLPARLLRALPRALPRAAPRSIPG